MKFDLIKFKHNYAAPIIRWLYIELALILLWIPTRIFNPDAIPQSIQWVMAILCMVFLPLTFCYYLDLKRQARTQFITISNGKLIATRVLERGLAGGSFVDHSLHIEFEQICNVIQDNRWLIIDGKIHIVDKYNNTSVDRYITRYKLPRTFNGEEQILALRY